MHPQQQHNMQREAQFRHMSMMQGKPHQGIPGNAGSPSADPPFNPSAGGPPFSANVNAHNRMGGQNKSMAMMPPPSPAMNGAPKDQSQPGGSKDNKNQNQGQGQNQNTSNGHSDGSPRNATSSAQTPNSGGQAPPPGTPVPNQNNMGINMAASPSSLMGNPQQQQQQQQSSMNQQQQSLSLPLSNGMASSVDMGSNTPNIFSSEFIQSVASSLDELDPTFLRPEDINFERDFGQWFNPDEATALLDLK